VIHKNDFTEKRKHCRFKVKKGTVVEFYKPRLFNFGKPRVFKSAPITDISAGGLAFQYIDNETWLQKFKELSISKPSDEIQIDYLPYEVVSDFTISTLPDDKFIKRCSVKFENLTPEQKSQLDNFLQHHTVSAV
jgi:hypothetical protein